MKILDKLLALSLILLMAPALAFADDKQEIAELRRRLDALEKKQAAEITKAIKQTELLADELQRTKISGFIPEKADLKSRWGMGPAASGVYQIKNGLSIGGYGEGLYRNYINDEGTKKDQADFLRLVGYLGYKFSDSIVFNSEVEFEHGTTGATGGDKGTEEGEVSVEFAYLDFLHTENFNSRVGLILVPMGFINEMHEPTTYHGVRRPEVEQTILPSTWRENGFGFFGEYDAAGKLEYRTYLLNGLRASRFTANGIRDGRQKGNRAIFEDVAWTGRVDYTPDWAKGLQFGGSFWVGDSGQDDLFNGENLSVRTTITDAHAQWKIDNLELRLLGAWGQIDDAGELSTALNQVIGERFEGWYGEAAYNIMPHISSGEQYLAPFFRYEAYDTHARVASGFTADESRDRQAYSYGLSYKPINNVVLKLEYRDIETNGSTKSADEIDLGVGFAF